MHHVPVVVLLLLLLVVLMVMMVVVMMMAVLLALPKLTADKPYGYHRTVAPDHSLVLQVQPRELLGDVGGNFRAGLWPELRPRLAGPEETLAST
jgi:hypothetical protein